MLWLSSTLSRLCDVFSHFKLFHKPSQSGVCDSCPFLVVRKRLCLTMFRILPGQDLPLCRCCSHVYSFGGTLVDNNLSWWWRLWHGGRCKNLLGSSESGWFGRSPVGESLVLLRNKGLDVLSWNILKGRVMHLRKERLCFQNDIPLVFFYHLQKRYIISRHFYIIMRQIYIFVRQNAEMERLWL